MGRFERRGLRGVAMSWLSLLKLAATLSAGYLNASPLAAARDMHQAGAVASQNPLVFAMVAFNCSVWCLYGVVLRNWFPLVAANLVGVTSGTYALLIFCKVEKMCKEAEKEKGEWDTDSRQTVGSETVVRRVSHCC